MNNYDKISNYAKENNGYITTKETESLEVNSTFLSNSVNEKNRKSWNRYLQIT